MRILLAESTSYFGLGGAAKVGRELIQGLAQLGHSCAVVSLEDRNEMAVKGFRPGNAPGVAELEVDGLKVFASEKDQWRPMSECLRTFKPDWTLISEGGVLLLTIALEEYDPSRIVLIAQSTITNLPTESSGAIEDNIRSLLRKTRGIVTVSNYMRDYIKEWSGLDSTVLYPAAYGSGPFTHFHNFDSGYVSMINPCSYKGIAIFLALARSLPRVKFAAITSWGTTAEDRAALLQLPNVTLLKPERNLDDIFKQIKVLLVPSLWGEALGLVVGDAMLRGIPVLASYAGGLPEAKLGVDYVLPVNMIERYELDSKGQVRPVIPKQDVSMWMKALNDVITDRALYERLSLASREAALSFVGNLGPHHFERYLEGLAAAEQRSEAASFAAK